MSERIYKLQPNRVLHLRGFDSLGAAAALHHATANSFKVSGVFRDPADFCVLMLHDADNFYEHPSIRYLPDFDFDGLTLSFDVHYSGLRPLDSPRYATIDWPYLDVIREDSTTARIPLFANAVQNGGTWTAASGTLKIIDNGLKEYDRVTLWYLNYAFDYIVPKVECSYAFVPQGTQTVHSITVAGVAYSYTEVAGDTDYSIAQRLTDQLASCPYATATRTFGQVDLRASKSDGLPFDVSSSASTATYVLHGVAASTVAVSLADQINSLNWPALGVVMPIQASPAGANLTITAGKPGEDGNAISVYCVAKNSRLTSNLPELRLDGGVSDAIWHVTLDFAALGIPRVRQMWLTFAPPLNYGAAFASTEWEAAFTNWTLTGLEEKRKLQVAGPWSIRVEDSQSSCSYTGTWNPEAGFYSRGFAHRCSGANDAVVVTYESMTTHDLYLGTSLYKDRGKVGIQVDGDAETELDCSLDHEPAVVTRRSLRKNVAAGRHTVRLRSKSGFFYFDFLEAAVPSDVPPPRRTRTNVSPALDYSTDHTYKLSPARLLWMFDQLGFAGPMNEYIGVFWWNQRKCIDAIVPVATVTFDGVFKTGDQIFVNIGAQPAGKTVFDNETNPIFARHFAQFINATYVGVWASSTDNVLTIAARSPTAAYSFPISTSTERVSGSTGTATARGSLQGGSPGTWVVDPSQTPPLNRGAREWHADFYTECAARNREIVTSASMELVNPPPGFAAQYKGGTPVITSVGFGSLSSTHCTFNSLVRQYQTAVFGEIAALQAAAGLVPRIQFGEFCWWYFPKPGAGMAFYDAETVSSAGSDLYVFQTPDDDPTAHAGDATFLRDRLRDHVAAIREAVQTAVPGTKVEVLFPYDVNYPQIVGIHRLGGRLLNYINFPPEWAAPSTSGLDRLKMEALDFGSSTRSLDLAREAVEFPLKLGWPRSQTAYLVPVFNGGCPWPQEYLLAKDAGIPVINFWAFDHFCIFNLSVAEPGRMSRSVRFV